MLTHAELLRAVPAALRTVALAVPDGGVKYIGKVRDTYLLQGQRVLITTDRVSAFDRVLGCIPFKGQVLNQLSGWWFAQTRDIVANHVLDLPDPNVTIAREAHPLPVEVVVRGYITGVTKTSLWSLYAQGERRPYGIPLPDGLRKNDPLPAPIITPTTKAEAGGHDERLTRDELLARGLVSPALWEQVETAALALFARGQELTRRAGLILVDTKYEFGLVDGQLTLIDELHTPDSSRFWTVASYDDAAVRGGGNEPEHLDKEYLRAWFAAQGYRGEGEPPAMPDDFVAQVAARYVAAYEHLTSTPFEPGEQPADERIRRKLLLMLMSTSDG
ncbi:MAG: phosphoribosylaminoimidazolesuccinocarboxamide synthase [Chloroflexaceae bacterium]|nr:phosphoribosylaminoimidazolesuccinocarboxamide synthase [Chloroflexaceae bacterium]